MTGIFRLWKEFAARMEPGGTVDVKFREPEFPYHFDFEPIFDVAYPLTQPLKWMTFSVSGGKLKLMRAKPGKPIVVEIYINSNNIDVIRNDDSLPINLLQSFYILSSEKAMVIKKELYLTIGDEEVNEQKKIYEKTRLEVRQVWNNYINNS